MTIWRNLRQEFVHAFALMPTAQAFTSEDTALLEKIADLIVRRGMAAPALLFLESLGPCSFLGSQVGHGLRPFLELACDAVEMERLAIMLERRDSVDRLVTLIQAQTISST